MGGTELFLCLLFLSCQLRLIHTPKWQILGWPDQFQQTEKIIVEWEDRSMCFWTDLGIFAFAFPGNRLLFIFLIPRLMFLFLHVSFCMSLLRDFSDQPEKIRFFEFYFYLFIFSNSRFYLCSRSHFRELPFDSRLLKQQMKYGPQFANEELESQTIKWHTKSQSY